MVSGSKKEVPGGHRVEDLLSFQHFVSTSCLVLKMIEKKGKRLVKAIATYHAQHEQKRKLANIIPTGNSRNLSQQLVTFPK